jgi:hypothetical protein
MARLYHNQIGDNYTAGRGREASGATVLCPPVFGIAQPLARFPAGAVARNTQTFISLRDIRRLLQSETAYSG